MLNFVSIVMYTTSNVFANIISTTTCTYRSFSLSLPLLRIIRSCSAYACTCWNIFSLNYCTLYWNYFQSYCMPNWTFFNYNLYNIHLLLLRSMSLPLSRLMHSCSAYVCMYCDIFQFCGILHLKCFSITWVMSHVRIRAIVSVLQCVSVCCSVLQCVAVCCSVLQ